MKRIFKITLLVAVALCCLNPLSAQEEKTTQYAVKLYYNNGHPNARGYLTPSLLILKPKASHEFELSDLRIGIRNSIDEREDDNGQNSSYRTNDFNFGLRLKYEYGIKALEIKEKYKFSLHASAESYFNIFKRNRETNGETLSVGKSVGGSLYLIPRGTYDISERWFLDVNFPIEMMNIARTISHDETGIYGQSSIQNHFNFFSNIFRLRIGIGLKL